MHLETSLDQGCPLFHLSSHHPIHPSLEFPRLLFGIKAFHGSYAFIGLRFVLTDIVDFVFEGFGVGGRVVGRAFPLIVAVNLPLACACYAVSGPVLRSAYPSTAAKHSWDQDLASSSFHLRRL